MRKEISNTTTTPEPIVTTTPELPVLPIGTSGKYAVDMNDAKHLLRNALVVMAGAGLTYVSQHVGDIKMDQSLQLVVVPILAGLIDLALRFLKNNQTDK